MRLWKRLWKTLEPYTLNQRVGMLEAWVEELRREIDEMQRRDQ